MLTAIEAIVGVFETLIYGTPGGAGAGTARSANDNEEMGEDERRWAAYR